MANTKNKTKKKIQRKPLSENAKTILVFVISVVVILGAGVGLFFGLRANRSVFDYLLLEVDSSSETYKITAVSKELDGKVKIPSTYQGKKITAIDDNAFYKSNVERLILPDSINYIGNYAFAESTKLKGISTPDDLVTIGDNAFYGCTRLKSFKTSEKTTTIGSSAFRKCVSLETLVLREGLETIKVGAFGRCSSLEEVLIPKSVTNIGGAIFTYCTDLEEIKVADGNEKYKAETNCLIDIENNELISGCKKSSIPNGVITIGESAFEGISELKKINFPDSVKTIETGAFHGCSKLGLESNGSVNFNKVEVIGRLVFSNCNSLIYVNLSGNLSEVGANAFANCEKLETVYITAEGLTSLRNFTFFNCSKLKNVDLGNNIAKIEQNCFGNCLALTDIYIPSSIIELEGYVFSGCNSSLVIKTELTGELSGFNEKYNYINDTEYLVVEWGVEAE